MRVLRLKKNEIYGDWDVIAVHDDDFCNNSSDWAKNGLPLVWAEPWEMLYETPDDSEIKQGWNYDGEEFHAAATLKRIKKDKWNEIGAAYDEHDRNGIMTTSFGYPVQVGQAHVLKLDGAIRFAEMTGTPEIYITDAQDVTHYGVALEDAKTILAEQMSAALGAHAKKQELRGYVAAAETIEEVGAILW